MIFLFPMSIAQNSKNVLLKNRVYSDSSRSIDHGEIQILTKVKQSLINGENEIADSIFNQVKNQNIQSKSEYWKALYFHIKGLFDFENGDYTASIQNYQSAFNYYKKEYRSNYFPEWLGLQNHMGRVWIVTNKLDQAEKQYQYILTEVKKINPTFIDSLQLSNIYNNVGVIRFYEGKLDEAYRYYDRSRTIAVMSRHDRSVQVGRALYNMGMVKEEKGFLIDAKILYERALEIYLEVLGAKQSHVAEVYGSLGNIHLSRYELSKAQYYFQKDLELSQKIYGEDHVETTWGYENLARAFQVEGKDSLAKSYYEKVLAIREKAYHGRHIYISNVLLSLAELEKDISTSISVAQKAWEIENQITAHPTIGKLNISIHLFQKYIELGNWNLAQAEFVKVYQIAQQLFGHHKHAVFTQIHLLSAKMYEGLKDIQNSKKYLQFAFESTMEDSFDFKKKTKINPHQILFIPEYIQVVTEQLDFYLKYRTVEDLIGILPLLESTTEAIQFHQKRRTSDDISKNFIQLYKEFFENSLLAALKIWRSNHDDKLLNKAFEFGEYIKQLPTIELMQGLDVYKISNLPETTLWKEYQLKKDIIYLQSILTEKPDNNSDVIKKLQVLYREEEEFYNKMSKYHPEYFHSKYKWQKYYIKELQSDYLNSDDILWHSTFIDSVEYLFVITKDQIIFKEGISIKYEKVIEQLITSKLNKMIVIPDYSQQWNSLEGLQFKGKYLLERFSFIYNNSVDHYFSSSKKSSLINNKILAFAPVLYKSPQLSELKESEKEIEGISKYYNVKPFVREEATKTNFIQNLLLYGGLHLATHIQYNPINPHRSIVYFSPDDSIDNGHMFAYEIFGTPMRTELVTLSACHSKKTNISNYAFSGIADAFFYNGCRNILMTLWEIEDKVAKSIVVGFYRYLSKGYTKEEALKLSKVDYLKNADKYKSDPYYWSGIILHGDQNEIKLSPSFLNRNWILLALFLIIVLIIIIIKFR